MKIALMLLIVGYFLPMRPENIRINPQVDILHYEFNIAINDTTDRIEGITLVKAGIKGRLDSFDLDLKNIDDKGKGMKVASVVINKKECRWIHSNNKLSLYIPLDLNTDSAVMIEISYSGIPADGLIISKDKFGDRTFFADHWPDRASNYLPVVDHPADKATVDFIITAPSHYKVVASGYLLEESPVRQGYTLTHWKEDIPLPVKVMTFGAAPFAVQLAGVVNNTPVWTWVYWQNRKEGFYDYSVAVKPLLFYSTLIGTYPYEKLANVQSKTIFGGLENAGCIFYSENSVTGNGRAEGLIAHEIAHQWFGNSVTEKDWHHIWLSEGFATYLASVYMEKNYGTDRLKESMKSARDRVLRSSQRNPGPVIDTTITDLMKLLSENSYQKGAWVLHMLRNEIGDEKFWAGIRLYYERFRNGNALTEDFEKVMEKTSGMDLVSFFHQWLYVPGQPVLKISNSPADKKGTVIITIEQTQNYIFSFTIELLLKDSTGTRTISIPVNSKIVKTVIKAGSDLTITPDPEVKLLFRSI